MDIMSFMQTMGSSEIGIIAAFFIGLMAAISPCPLATNITAIAYISKKIGNSKHTLLVGFLYTLGRMFTYVLIASLIVWFGVNMQEVAMFLNTYGEKLLGPLLLIVGIVMLDLIKINMFKSNDKIDKLKEYLSEKGFIGSFLLGIIFALAFCPFSAVLYFGMMMPIALAASDGLFIPASFALATGLPVILFSLVLVYSVSKLGQIMNKIQTFEKWMRKAVAIIFIIMGLYYTFMMFF